MIRYIGSKFNKTKIDRTTILVFANYQYLPILMNWIEALKKIDIDNFLIISLDNELHGYLQSKNVNSLLRPCELDLGKLWIHRVEILLELMKDGHDVIHSDADAVWLKDPLPYLNALPQDMIFSQGTIWPPDVQEKWGFVLCCGFFMLRSNKKTLDFMRELLARVKEDKDDQVSCNRLLLEKKAVWENPTDCYSIDFRGKQFICSLALKKGQCAQLSLALLPHQKFQRIYETTDDVYIRHLISDKNSKDIVQMLQEYDCWFIT